MEDVNKALYKILFDKNNTGETFHISTNKFISIKELVFKIFEKLNSNKNLIKISDERKGKDYGYFLNSKKLRKVYKWHNEYKLDDGINETIDWVEKNYNILKNENIEYKHKS